MSAVEMPEPLVLELSAQVLDGDDRTITVIVSGDDITLEPSTGARIWISRAAWHGIGDLLDRFDRAMAAISAPAEESRCNT
ncbi:MAG: hypothetical protein VYB54_13890 [Pseudomonadota bacterium]|nr:hypothetical protein [Pseudomonadota bacterium]